MSYPCIRIKSSRVDAGTPASWRGRKESEGAAGASPRGPREHGWGVSTFLGFSEHGAEEEIEARVCIPQTAATVLTRNFTFNHDDGKDLLSPRYLVPASFHFHVLFEKLINVVL